MKSPNYSNYLSTLLYSGSWKDKQFKSYNFNALGAPVSCGHLHPLMKVRTEIRQIFLEMGLVSVRLHHSFTFRENIKVTVCMYNIHCIFYDIFNLISQSTAYSIFYTLFIFQSHVRVQL